MSERDDLDRLVGELKDWAPADTQSTTALDRWLRILTERGAADLFLVAGFAPAIRLNGIVTPLGEGPLDGDDIEAAVVPSLHPQALKAYRSTGSADISLRRTDLGRFRVNLHRERGRPAAVGRLAQLGNPQLLPGGQTPAFPWGRDTPLGTDEANARGTMWGDELRDTVGEEGLGLQRTAGGLAKRVDVAALATNESSSLRVVHTGLRVTGARKASEVGRDMAAHFDDFRQCAEASAPSEARTGSLGPGQPHLAMGQSCGSRRCCCPNRKW